MEECSKEEVPAVEHIFGDGGEDLGAGMSFGLPRPEQIESTFAPWVVLVINDNILCGWTNAFIKYVSGNSITLAWQKD